MPSFLIETYLADDPAAATEEIARARLAGGRADGISYVRTTRIPGDETCFHLFEAPSSTALSEAAQLAGLTHLRIVEAVETTAKPHVEVSQ